MGRGANGNVSHQVIVPWNEQQLFVLFVHQHQALDLLTADSVVSSLSENRLHRSSMVVLVVLLLETHEQHLTNNNKQNYINPPKVECARGNGKKELAMVSETYLVGSIM